MQCTCTTVCAVPVPVPGVSDSNPDPHSIRIQKSKISSTKDEKLSLKTRINMKNEYYFLCSHILEVGLKMYNGKKVR
jgi:hypothetical protein